MLDFGNRTKNERKRHENQLRPLFFVQFSDMKYMKSRANLLFICFCLGLLAVLVEVNSYFQGYFSDSKEYLKMSQKLQIENEREKLKTALVQNQLRDIEQDIAKVLPTDRLRITNSVEYRLKQMASSLRLPASDESVDLSAVLMEKGKSELKQDRYEKAARVFQEVIQKYPVSTQVVEAHFLLGESFFQSGKYDECLDVVYDMMNHFPQNEMTGYLMLRNAQILASRKRAAEAAELYRVVIRQFPSSEALRKQAEKLLRGVEV